jgi:hypothetical protein
MSGCLHSLSYTLSFDLLVNLQVTQITLAPVSTILSFITFFLRLHLSVRITFIQAGYIVSAI